MSREGQLWDMRNEGLRSDESGVEAKMIQGVSRVGALHIIWQTSPEEV